MLDTISCLMLQGSFTHLLPVRYESVESFLLQITILLSSTSDAYLSLAPITAWERRRAACCPHVWVTPSSSASIDLPVDIQGQSFNANLRSMFQFHHANVVYNLQMVENGKPAWLEWTRVSVSLFMDLSAETNTNLDTLSGMTGLKLLLSKRALRRKRKRNMFVLNT